MEAKDNAAPTIGSCRVQCVPIQLAPTHNVSALALRSCACCAAEVADEGGFVKCEDCRLPLYCSESCRQQDFRAHQSDGYCQQLYPLVNNFRDAFDEYENNSDAQDEWYRMRFGDEFDGNNHLDFLGGRMSLDPYYKPTLDCQSEQAAKLALHPTSARAIEEGFVELLDMKQQTYLADPYNLDERMVSVLLKLYREDDLVSFIFYWLDWRSNGPEIENLRDPVIENWNTRDDDDDDSVDEHQDDDDDDMMPLPPGDDDDDMIPPRPDVPAPEEDEEEVPTQAEHSDDDDEDDDNDEENLPPDLSSYSWPFPIIKDARLVEIVEQFRSFPAQRAGVSVPIKFALAVLVVKMRFITVYRKQAQAETLYLILNEGGLRLSGDDRRHVLSFLVEGGLEWYLTQLDHVNLLLDYIDERDATLLPALVDPAVQAQRSSTDQISFAQFLDDYGNGKPVVDMIKSMLVERYTNTTPGTL